MVFLQFRSLFGAVLHDHGKIAAQQSIQGLFPIHIAAEELHPDAVSYLLRWGEDVNLQSLSAKKTALHYAVRLCPQDEEKWKRQRTLVQVLNAFKARHDVPDARGHVPLYNAILTKDTDLIKLLIDDAPINHADVDGDTHLHIATYINSEEIVRLLIEKEANPLLHNHDGQTPCHVAAQKPNACLEGIDEACSHQGVELVDTFIQEDSSGHTPLDYAAIHLQKKNFQYIWERIEESPSRSIASYKPMLDRLYGEDVKDIRFTALQHTLETLSKPM